MSGLVLDEAACDEEDELLGPPLNAADTSLQASVGHKTITAFGSLALLTNNVTGPGVAALPLVFVSSGWFPSLLLLCVLAATSGAAAHLLCDAIRALPGNAGYARRVELLSAAQELLPRWAYWASFVAFLLSFQVANIGSIVESAQTMDGLLLEVFGGSCALEASPVFRLRCVSRTNDSSLDSPFGDAWVLSLGYCVVAAITVPLGYYNLDDSVWVQQGCFVALGLIVFIWLWGFALTDFPCHVPVAGRDAGGLIGTLLFNFMFVATVPSWLNEKAAGVSARRSVWSAVSIGTTLFAAVGLFGAAAYGGAPDGFTPSRDLLTVLVRRSGRFARAAAYAFPPVALMSGIPVLSICIRYNLVEQRVASKAGANLFAVALPWAAALLLYRGGLLGAAMDWSSLFVAVPLNLLLPAWLYLRATRGGGPPNAADLRESLLPGEPGGGGDVEWRLRGPQGDGNGDDGDAAAPPGDDDRWYESAAGWEEDVGPPPPPWLHSGAAARGLWEQAVAGEWAHTEVGRKRAAARAVLAVGAALNVAAWIVKVAV